MTEVWASIPEAAGYEVTEWGRVRSLDRVITRSSGRPMTLRGQEMRPHRGERGSYLTVNLAGRTRYIHSLVVHAFIGPKPFEQAQVRHLNGDPLDNWVGNLAWGTPAENAQDSVLHGVLTKPRCLRGHLLVEPNIQTRSDLGGTRLCVACLRARRFISQRNRRGRNPVAVELVDALADDYYRKIMSDPVPLACSIV